jgi:hypothetical protein
MSMGGVKVRNVNKRYETTQFTNFKLKNDRYKVLNYQHHLNIDSK